METPPKTKHSIHWWFVENKNQSFGFTQNRREATVMTYKEAFSTAKEYEEFLKNCEWF
jgi:hypothetical protein